MGYGPVNISNNILRRAFEEGVEVSPMKLQKLLFFVASEYAKRSGRPLLDGSFQAWQYGPVVRSVYDEFKSYRAGPIRSYGKDAQNKAYLVNENTDPALQQSLNAVWAAAKNVPAVTLSRITHADDSAWSRNVERGWIPNEALVEDHTYQALLGLPEGPNVR